VSEHNQTEPVPFDAIYGSSWGDADPRSGGRCPVNVTLSVGELLVLRDYHFALLREADCRHVKGDMGELEYHEIRARHFDMLVRQVAPDLAPWVGHNRNPYEAGQ
jgi:hypothetical protein